MLFIYIYILTTWTNSVVIPILTFSFSYIYIYIHINFVSTLSISIMIVLCLYTNNILYVYNINILYIVYIICILFCWLKYCPNQYNICFSAYPMCVIYLDLQSGIFSIYHSTEILLVWVFTMLSILIFSTMHRHKRESHSTYPTIVESKLQALMFSPLNFDGSNFLE